MSVKKSIARVFSANMLSLFSGLVNGFIIPAVISKSAYADVKTYTFYVSYLGILHLGFVDGMYIKYGGRELDDIDKGEFKAEHNVFIIGQLIISMILLILAINIGDTILFLLAATVIPVNTLQFHQMFYQAVGRFKEYSRNVYIYNGLLVMLNIVLAIIFKEGNFVYYCLAVLLSNIVACILLEYKFIKSVSDIKPQYTTKILNNIKVGVFILVGNLSVIFFQGIDRWFIKIFFDSNAFADYSYATSMLSIVNTFVSAISVVFYNYLTKWEDESKLKTLKKYFLILGSMASLGYFALAGVVNIIIPKYSTALNIIAISFAAYPYMIVINALYVNLYKARKDQHKYVKIVFGMVVVSTIYNLIAVYVFKTSESIAAATTIAFITWYVYSMRDFKYLKADFKEIIYLSILSVSFLMLSHFTGWLFGGIVYFAILVIMNLLFSKNEIMEIVKVVLKRQ
ncbi:MAG: capsular biosynthesis protein [Clostridium sp.]|nr:capsular biosynthesis protein [Clostridium sp.]